MTPVEKFFIFPFSPLEYFFWFCVVILLFILYLGALSLCRYLNSNCFNATYPVAPTTSPVALEARLALNPAPAQVSTAPLQWY